MVTELVVTALLVRVVWRSSGFWPSFGRAWRAAVAAAVLWLVLWVVRDAGIAMLALAGTAGYSIAAWLVGAFGRGDLALFRMTAEAEKQ